MDKLTSLKQHLIDRVPGLKDHPGDLHVFADEGAIIGDFSSTLSFSYQWQTTLIITDYHGHPDHLFLNLILWLQQNQRDLKQNDINFIIDPLDSDRFDIRCTFPTDQRVIVSVDNDGNYNTEHPPEPTPDWEGDFGTLTTVTADGRANV